VNLIEHHLLGGPVIRFADNVAFQQYTFKGRTFPLGEAKGDGFIRALLRKM
jgi:hypothetical protein